MKLPDELSGLFIAHASVGHAIVVNVTHDAVRQRLAIAHGYAHAVCEPMGTIRVCSIANARELIERRGRCVCGRLPPAGFRRRGDRAPPGEGPAESTEYWAFDAATEQSVRAEERSTPGSQTMTYVDVVWIARRFGTPYTLTVSRLLGLGLISESDSKPLLRPKSVELAKECLAILGPASGRVSSSDDVVALSDLRAEQFYMAIEAYRRGLMTKADLMLEASSLSRQLPGLSESRLLELAEAAR